MQFYNMCTFMQFCNMSLSSAFFTLFFPGERKDVVPVKNSCNSLYSGMSSFAQKGERQAPYVEPKNKQG